jgi:hypothetical protein
MVCLGRCRSGWLSGEALSRCLASALCAWRLVPLTRCASLAGREPDELDGCPLIPAGCRSRLFMQYALAATVAIGGWHSDSGRFARRHGHHRFGTLA